MFEKFGATELQKEKIKAFRNNYYNKLEEEKREKYNPDNIFKNTSSKAETNNTEKLENNINAVLQYKELFFIKFKNFIFKILHINK